MSNTKPHTEQQSCAIDVDKIYSSPKHLKRALNLYDSILASNYSNGMSEILTFLLDVQAGIKRCEFKPRTLRYIEL